MSIKIDNAIQSLLDLYQKEKSEYERELRIKYQRRYDLVKEHYISKDKIKEKIKELENKPWLFNNDETLLNILKELLEVDD